MITTNIRWMPLALGALTAISLGVGCSSPGHVKSESKTGQDLASNGPTVVDARTQPETIKLNQSLQATEGAEVLADVKDFTAKVTDVKLRFVRVPLEVPMKNIGGTTW